MCPVFIENISPDSEIKPLSLKKLARKILRDFKEKGGLNIILVSDSYMRKLNQRFTRRKGTTDVLSFSFREKGVTKDKGVFLGEVYISADKARKQAEDYQVPVEQELKRLVTHGVLHLLGCEHKNKKNQERMREKEEEYIST